MLVVAAIKITGIVGIVSKETGVASVGNRQYSYSHGWTGTNMQPRLMRGTFSNSNDIPRTSLNCMLVPV